MKALWSITGYSILASVAAAVIALGGTVPARSEDVRIDAKIAAAVAATTTVVVDTPRTSGPRSQQQAELTHAVSALSENGGVQTTKGRGARCYYKCPPPVGSVTASPQVVSVQTPALGTVTLHWRWDQSSTQVVSQHGCLWVSSGDESQAHLVECHGPGRTYATTVGWIGAGNYIFRVAPGNPKGLFTKPVAGLFQLAQTIVVGAPQ